MSKTIYKVGDIIKNSIGQFTKVIGITNGTMFALSGWSNLKSAKEATVATIFLNIYGLEACDAKVVGSDKTSDDDHSSDDDGDDDVDLENFVVTGEIYPLNEDGSTQDTALELYSIQEVPAEVGAKWVEDGLAVEVPTKSAVNKMNAEAIKEFAGEIGVENDGTRAEVLEKVLAFLGL